MNLQEFIKAEKKDSNAWWRLDSGEHQVLFDQAIDEIDRLKELIEKSDLIEVDATTVEKHGCNLTIVPAGKMLAPRDYLEREEEKTKLLSKLAQYARDNWILRDELGKLEADK